MAHRRWALALLSISSIVYLPSVNAQVPGQPYRLSDKDVNIIIRRIELRSDQFRSSLDSALDKSRYKSTRMEYVNSFIKDFYEQTKRLRDQFDKRSSATSDVQAVLESAVPIDEFMTRNRVSSEAQNHWTGLRNKLEALPSLTTSSGIGTVTSLR